MKKRRGRGPILKFVLILLLPVLVLVALLASVLQKPVRRTRLEVADILERFLTGPPSERGDKEWDEFTCFHIADRELEAIRKRCARYDQTGPEARAALHALVTELRRA